MTESTDAKPLRGTEGKIQATAIVLHSLNRGVAHRGHRARRRDSNCPAVEYLPKAPVRQAQRMPRLWPARLPTMLLQAHVKPG
jgi:hypothetical protein